MGGHVSNICLAHTHTPEEATWGAVVLSPTVMSEMTRLERYSGTIVATATAYHGTAATYLRESATPPQDPPRTVEGDASVAAAAS